MLVLVLVVPLSAPAIPGRLGQYLATYLPDAWAGQALLSTGDALVGPWQGFGILCAWTVVLLGAAAVLLRRRDA